MPVAYFSDIRERRSERVPLAHFSSRMATSAYGNETPHCSRRSRRLIRRRVLASCTESCGSSWARLGLDVLVL